MTLRNSANESKPTPGMEAATRALAARKGKPTEADAPPPTTFPSSDSPLGAAQIADVAAAVFFDDAS